MGLFRSAAITTGGSRRYGGSSEHTFWLDVPDDAIIRRDELRPSGIPPRPSEAPVAAVALTGLAAGATAGAIAGPPGAILGAIIGGAVGVAAGRVMEARAHDERVIRHRLDEDIGVTSGDLGAADPEQPPPRFGAYSMPSMGMGRGTYPPPAEGPFPSPERAEFED